jgi:hypothetical protein
LRGAGAAPDVEEDLVRAQPPLTDDDLALPDEAGMTPDDLAAFDAR